MTRALLVDDHAMVRRGARQLLTEELPGLVIEEAATAAEGCAKLQGAPFDLAIVDLNLPDRSGLTVLAAARALRPPTPVLILSVYPESAFAMRCLKLGAAGYLSKEGAAEELTGAVRRVLAGERCLSPGQAARLAGPPGALAPASVVEGLSERELEVLRRVALGRSLREIAAGLGISEKTVASYRARLSDKLGISTNVELTRFALQHRLVD